LVFDREEVEVAPIGKEALSGSIRTFGNGGLFGYAGFFRNKALGSYRMYIKRMKDLAVITDKAGKKTVINLRMPCNATPASTASMEDKV
ncbi:PH domain-containing protein, partial [Porphyromonas loveana]